MRNIEMKARVTDSGGLEKRVLALGARFAADLVQHDVFFRCDGGRLKLRLGETPAQLIHYRRGDRASLRPSDYELIEIPDGPGQAATYIQDHLAEDNKHLYDKVMLENCFGIICGDFCGKCLHKCPSKKLSAKDLKDCDFSDRHSSMSRSSL